MPEPGWNLESGDEGRSVEGGRKPAEREKEHTGAQAEVRGEAGLRRKIHSWYPWRWAGHTGSCVKTGSGPEADEGIGHRQVVEKLQICGMHDC